MRYPTEDVEDVSLLQCWDSLVQKKFDKFIEIMKQLHINIPLIEAIQQMPNYSEFMKDVLTKRRRIGEFETVALTQECSQMFQGRIPPKLKDPGSFTIPCTIGDVYVGRALCDLGASINLMPLLSTKSLALVLQGLQQSLSN
jgi:hypothetical protein